MAAACRISRFDREASRLDLLAGMGWQAGDHQRLLAETKWSRTERDARNRMDGTGLDQRYTHASPKLGAIWQANEKQRLFANLSRSNEAPSGWEIASANVPATNPAGTQAELLCLRTQIADTLEIGSRGCLGSDATAVNWGLILYRSHVGHELIEMTDNYGNRVGTDNHNADTRHQGIETGVNGHIPVADHGALEYRLAWNYSDFTFRGGESSGNQIAGVPKHLISAELMWRRGGWQFGPNVRWLPGNTPTDHANTRAYTRTAMPCSVSASTTRPTTAAGRCSCTAATSPTAVTPAAM